MHPAMELVAAGQVRRSPRRSKKGPSGSARDDDFGKRHPSRVRAAQQLGDEIGHRHEATRPTDGRGHDVVWRYRRRRRRRRGDVGIVAGDDVQGARAFTFALAQLASFRSSSVGSLRRRRCSSPSSPSSPFRLWYRSMRSRTRTGIVSCPRRATRVSRPRPPWRFMPNGYRLARGAHRPRPLRRRSAPGTRPCAHRSRRFDTCDARLRRGGEGEDVGLR